MGYSSRTVASPAQILVQPFSQAYGKISAAYYTSASAAGAIAAFDQFLFQNNLEAIPIVLAKQTTFQNLSCYVSVAIALSHVRMGIYTDVNSYPGTLIVQGEIDTSTTGLKNVAITNTLAAGRYWLVLNDELNGVNLKGIDAAYMVALGATDLNTNGSNTGYTAGLAYGALPATFPAGAALDFIIACMALQVA